MIMKRKDENYEKISKLFRKNGELKLVDYWSTYTNYIYYYTYIKKRTK